MRWFISMIGGVLLGFFCATFLGISLAGAANIMLTVLCTVTGVIFSSGQWYPQLYNWVMYGGHSAGRVVLWGVYWGGLYLCLIPGLTIWLAGILKKTDSDDLE